VQPLDAVSPLWEWIQEAVASGASDLQVIAGAPPVLRVDGQLRFGAGPPLQAAQIRELLGPIMTPAQRAQLAELGDVDFALSLPGGARFRVNVYRQRDTLAAVFRVVPARVPAFSTLGLPPSVADFARRRRGLVLVTGATGSGKSTTLAALVALINEERRCHVVTIEDPIEFYHEHGQSIVSQRELGQDTPSFAQALKHVLRQAPDVILVGEMRDLETTALALTAAETGHLVLSTLHTNDAAQTVDRIVDIFPPEQQDQVRLQLAATLVGICCQQLLPRTPPPGRVVAAEVLVATPAVRNLIREGKTHQLYSVMQTGAGHGMQTLEQSLAALVKAGTIAFEKAAEVANDREELQKQLAVH
jgi:twitching motility protein PilT